MLRQYRTEWKDVVRCCSCLATELGVSPANPGYVMSMKIVHIQPYYQPGFGYQENCLPAEQARLGHEVAILTSTRYSPVRDYDAKWGNVLGERKSARPGVSWDNGVKVVRLPVLLRHSNAPDR